MNTLCQQWRIKHEVSHNNWSHLCCSGKQFNSLLIFPFLKNKNNSTMILGCVSGIIYRQLSNKTTRRDQELAKLEMRKEYRWAWFLFACLRRHSYLILIIRGLRLSIGRCAAIFFPHPLSQLLVTALRSIPANYSHEFPRTKTAQCARNEARPTPKTTRVIPRPGRGEGTVGHVNSDQPSLRTSHHLS